MYDYICRIIRFVDLMFLVDFFFINDVVIVSCLILNLGTRRGHRKNSFWNVGGLHPYQNIVNRSDSSLSLGVSYQTGGKHQHFHQKKHIVCKNVDILDFTLKGTNISHQTGKKNHRLKRFRLLGGMLVPRRVHHPVTS